MAQSLLLDYLQQPPSVEPSEVPAISIDDFPQKLSILYKPKGRAGEYNRDGGYALNYFNGCEHGCSYCYAWGMFTKLQHRKPGDFLKPVLKKDWLKKLQRDAELLEKKHYTGPVFLCFSHDPYMIKEKETKATRQAIETLNGHGIAVRILTKGGSRAERDFDLLQQNPDNEFWVTISCWEEKTRMLYEANASPIDNRINALKKAAFHHIKTGVSIEPPLDAEECLYAIREVAPFADIINVGKWNHDRRANAINWRKFRADAIQLLEELGCNYYIKEDLRRA